MRFGDGLRSERERRGIALDDIAVATRVSLRNLSALEADRYDELPGGIRPTLDTQLTIDGTVKQTANTSGLLFDPGLDHGAHLHDAHQSQSPG